MKSEYILDTETNALVGYTALWCAVFRSIEDSKNVEIFRNVHLDPGPCRTFIETKCHTLVGHNIIGFDTGVLEHFVGKDCLHAVSFIDTLTISRVLNYKRLQGHSLASYGEQYKLDKSAYDDFSKWSQPLEDRCILDTEINYLLYKDQEKYIKSPRWAPVIKLELLTTQLCTTIWNNGFAFDYPKAVSLYYTVYNSLSIIRDTLREAFPSKSKFIRVVNPIATKKGTLHLKDFRFLSGPELDLRSYSPGEPFSLFEYEDFNPGSSKQRVERLNEAGWKPFNKTKGHIEALRNKDAEAIKKFSVLGWSTDEENLSTLPSTAPAGAKRLREYLLLSSRLSDLKEWIDIYEGQNGIEVGSGTTHPEKTPVDPVSGHPIGRIHGTFSNPGAWTMRVSHQAPNMANIPATKDRRGNDAVLGRECRELWTVPRGYKLVGVDAEGIQLRGFAHLCDDKRLIETVEVGSKEEGTDIHTLNMKILGSICQSRAVAKTYIYALFLGGQLGKQANILGCTRHEADMGLTRILNFYPGWKRLINGRLNREGAQGYFEAIDGRYVFLPEPRLVLAGHLQSFEKIVMAKAAQVWISDLNKVHYGKYRLVNWVHDEWQTEVQDVYRLPETVGMIQVAAIEQVGLDLNLNIKLTGNYVIGSNWAETH